MRTKHETHVARPAHASRWGFTLVELLLVMFILSVLVGLVVGVSWYVIEEGRKKETLIKQKNLLAAIDGFRKVTGHVPGELTTEKCTYNPDSSQEDLYSSTKLMANLRNVLTTGNYDNTNPDINSPIYKATHPFLGEDNGSALLTDAWGNSMLYLKNGGMGGTPLIVSAGPDGKFGYGGKTDGTYTTAQLTQFKKDNIRSDTN